MMEKVVNTEEILVKDTLELSQLCRRQMPSGTYRRVMVDDRVSWMTADNRLVDVMGQAFLEELFNGKEDELQEKFRVRRGR